MTDSRAFNFKCRVCGVSGEGRLHAAREMFFGTREVFHYAECAACGTLQLQDAPDLKRFYAADYYSFRPAQESSGPFLKKYFKRPLGDFVRARAADYYCDRRRPRRNLAGRYFAEHMKRMVAGFPDYIKDAPVDLNIDRRSSVLDVGSGAGATLLTLRDFGFRDLTGVDPFLGSDILYANGVSVHKSELFDLARHFDLILANHSVEHVARPQALLEQTRRLLRRGRYAIVRVPVVNRAWREYGADWVQLDPPRHLFLFTAEGFAALARKAGFEVTAIAYDSTAFQFWGSEQYRRDIPLVDERSYFVNPHKSIFSERQIDEFTARAVELNKEGEGDQAAFYLYQS